MKDLLSKEHYCYKSQALIPSDFHGSEIFGSVKIRAQILKTGNFTASRELQGLL